jgi:hypothetical protein
VTAAEVDAMFDELGPEGARHLQLQLSSETASTTECPRPVLLRAGLTTCNLLTKNEQHEESEALCTTIIQAFQTRGGQAFLESPDGRRMLELQTALRRSVEELGLATLAPSKDGWTRFSQV